MSVCMSVIVEVPDDFQQLPELGRVARQQDALHDVGVPEATLLSRLHTPGTEELAEQLAKALERWRRLP